MPSKAVLDEIDHVKVHHVKNLRSLVISNSAH